MHNGPAQNEVRSRTRSPSNGRVVAGRRETVLGSPVRGSERRRVVLAQARRRAGRCEQRWLEPVRPIGFVEAVTRVGDDRSAGLEVVGRRDRGAVAEGGVGDPPRAGDVEHLLGRVGGHPGRDLGPQVATVGEQLPVLHPLGMVDDHAEVEPLLTGPDPDADQSVAGLLDSRSHDGSARAERSSHHVRVGHGVVGQRQGERLEDRHVHELARCPLVSAERHHGADGRIRAGQPLADLSADEHRSPVRCTSTQPDDRARPGLQGELGGGPFAPRTVQPERRDGRDGQMGRGTTDGVGRQGRQLGQAGSPRPHDGVGAAQQIVHRCQVPVGIGDHALLGRRQEREQRAVVTIGNGSPGGRPRPQRIALGRLDLDDLGAAVGQQLGAVGAGDPARQVDDDVLGQRRGDGHRSAGYSEAARPFLLSRHSGGNRWSKSFTALVSP